MPLLVTVEQAAANALGRWLARGLGPEVVVDTRWPDPGPELPPRIVTILLAGPPEEELLDPIVIDSQRIDNVRSLFTWRLSALRQPMQLDVWARFDTERDDLLAQLANLLNAGMGATLGVFNANPVRHGVVVPLADGWEGNADCLFDKPIRHDSSESALCSEYRATYRGWAEVDLTVTAPSVRLAAVRLRQRLSQARTGGSLDTTTVTPSGVIRT